MSDYDKLCKRLDEMAKAWGHHPDDRKTWGQAATAIRTVEERVVELEHELAEARKDGERLEHLESIMDEDLEHMHRGVVYFRILVGPLEYGSHLHRLSDLSGAIDATRESEGDGPEELDYPPTPTERLEMADRARRVK